MTTDQTDLTGEPIEDGGDPDSSSADEPEDRPCNVCEDVVLVDGEHAIEHGGQVICRDCSDVPVAFRAFCTACSWSVTHQGREFDRWAVRQLAQSDANSHESAEETFEERGPCDDAIATPHRRRFATAPRPAPPEHDTRWREVEPGSFDYERGKYDGRLFPRGLVGHLPKDVERAGHGPVPAIGFCPRCRTNARGTTGVRGVFDCPGCTYRWYDTRVGQPDYSIEDFTSSV